MSGPTTGAVAIIPVRVDSHRLPGKALLRETGQALFLHTVERAQQAGCFAEVLVATDNDEVRQEAEVHDVRCVMTSDRPRTGSERCAEALADCPEARYVVDVQGDWPGVAPADLERMVETLATEQHAIVTLAARLEDPEREHDPNVVKLVRDSNGNALYFSRLPIPYSRAEASGGPAAPRLRHIGVYGFPRKILEQIPGLASSGLDETEGLEQLRFLENGIPIHVLDAEGDPWGIETRADYDALLRDMKGNA